MLLLYFTDEWNICVTAIVAHLHISCRVSYEAAVSIEYMRIAQVKRRAYRTMCIITIIVTARVSTLHSQLSPRLLIHIIPPPFPSFHHWI